MDISVLVPIYNVEKYIEECLVSLFEQTKTDGVEFILVNDCTPDNSMNIARRVIANYPNLTVRIIEHNINRGIAATRQTGLDAMTGEYTLQIDSDDWCELNMLEELYKRVKETNADILCCDIYKNYANSEVYVGTPHFSNDGIQSAELLLDGKLHGYLYCKFIKRSLYVDNHILMVNNINLCEDLLFSFHLFCATNNIHYLPKAFYHYRRDNPNSITSDICISQSRSSFIYLPIELEKIVNKRKLNSVLGNAVIRRKLRAKFEALVYLNFRYRKEFANIHPEVNKYISTMTHLSPIVRFGWVQATKGRLYIFNIIQILSKIKNIINIKNQTSK